MGEVAAECGKTASDTEVRLGFVKSSYLLGAYIPLIRDLDLKNYSSESHWNIKEKLREYWRPTNLGLPVIKGIAFAIVRWCRGGRRRIDCESTTIP